MIIEQKVVNNGKLYGDGGGDKLVKSQLKQ